MTPAEKAQQLIAENPVMVFSKSWCSYSNRAKQVLRSFDAEITVYELDRESMSSLATTQQDRSQGATSR
jgi:glutaredoxin 3